MFHFHGSEDPYQAYIALESKLKALIARGEDESEQGDRLREAMVTLWYKLSAQQKREINKNVTFPELSE